MPAPAIRSARPVRVVVVDGDDLVRETLVALLGIGRRVEVVGMAGQVDAAFEIVAAAQPDVLLVDPRLPDFDAGLDLIRRLRRVVPTVRVLVTCTADLLGQAALSEGVDGCIRKTFRSDDLTAAILLASGGAALEPG